MKCNQRWIFGVLAVFFWFSSKSPAEEPCLKWFGCPVPDCIGKWCCDDYDAKCLPRICTPIRFGCDDYCKKELPCGCTSFCFHCDDYCKKCLPCVCASISTASAMRPSRQALSLPRFVEKHDGWHRCRKLFMRGCFPYARSFVARYPGYRGKLRI